MVISQVTNLILESFNVSPLHLKVQLSLLEMEGRRLFLLETN